MRRAMIVVLASVLTGCPSGEEVGKMAIASGGKGETNVTVTKGQQLHFWEDFNYENAGDGWVTDRLECFRWNIRLTQDGQKAKELKCWSLKGTRCDKKLSNSRKINCKLPDCSATINASGTVAIEARLEKTRKCNATVSDMALRIRRVDD